jgi:hypothetical protein
MPKYVRRPSTPVQRSIGIIVIGGFLVGVGYAFYRAPLWSALGMLALGIIAIVDNRKNRIRLRRLAAHRSGDSICEFRAALDSHAVDPWVIRAVYEQVQENLRPFSPAFPLHADDRLEEDLLIDGDDLSFDIAAEISQRTGRSLTHPIARQWSTPVLTARDLVYYFNRIPRDLPPQGTHSAGAA